MKRVINLSGGKDSTALVLWCLEKGEKFDDVIFFDTGWDFPEMQEHLNLLQQNIPVPISRVTAAHSFDYYFSEYERSKGKLKGLHGYGFCDALSRWCTAMKTQSIERYLKDKYPGETIQHWIGIAADEARRVKEDKLQAGTVRYPLIEWDKTEEDCLNYCYSKGYRWGGAL